MNSSNTNNKLYILEKENSVQYPILRDLYQFFSPRTKSITALFYGVGDFGIESHFLSSTGCKINIFDTRPGKQEKYNEYLQIFKTHAPIDHTNDWQTELSQRWILHKNFNFSSTLPFSFTGTFDLSGEQIQCEKFTQERVDFCKIDYDELNTHLIYSILNAGYRPGILLVNWNRHPDQYTDSMLCAGHLQNSGYALLAAEENWFLYIYTDQCIYETCSWARTDVSNPLIDEIKQTSISNLLNTTSNTLEKSKQ